MMIFRPTAFDKIYLLFTYTTFLWTIDHHYIGIPIYNIHNIDKRDQILLYYVYYSMALNEPYCIFENLFLYTHYTLLNTYVHVRLIRFEVLKQITWILNQSSDYIILVRFSHTTAICWEFIK